MLRTTLLALTFLCAFFPAFSISEEAGNDGILHLIFDTGSSCNSFVDVKIPRFIESCSFKGDDNPEAFALEWRIWDTYPKLLPDDLLRHTLFYQNCPFCNVYYTYEDISSTFSITVDGVVRKDNVPYGIVSTGTHKSISKVEQEKVKYLEIRGILTASKVRSLARKFPNVSLVHIFAAKVPKSAFKSMFEAWRIEYINFGAGLFLNSKKIDRFHKGIFCGLGMTVLGGTNISESYCFFPFVTSNYILRRMPYSFGCSELISETPHDNVLKYLDELCVSESVDLSEVEFPKLIGLRIEVEKGASTEEVESFLGRFSKIRSLSVDSAQNVHINIPQSILTPSLLDIGLSGFANFPSESNGACSLRSVRAEQSYKIPEKCIGASGSIEYMNIWCSRNGPFVNFKSLLPYKKLKMALIGSCTLKKADDFPPSIEVLETHAIWFREGCERFVEIANLKSLCIGRFASHYKPSDFKWKCLEELRTAKNTDLLEALVSSEPDGGYKYVEIVTACDYVIPFVKRLKCPHIEIPFEGWVEESELAKDPRIRYSPSEAFKDCYDRFDADLNYYSDRKSANLERRIVGCRHNEGGRRPIRHIEVGPPGTTDN